MTYLKTDENGQVGPEAVKGAIKPGTILISIMHANNEVGTINPVARIGKIAREAGIYFHTDAVQSFGKIPIDVQEMNADLLPISGHKIYGPRGIGALYIRRGVALDKLLYGGHQEKNRRAGTENIAGVVGLARAAQLAQRDMAETAGKVGDLRDYLQFRILTKIKNIHINGHLTERLYNTLNVSFLGCDSEALLMRLDMNGVAVSSGSACSSGIVEPSHVLKAMGLSGNAAQSAIRFSLGKDNTREEIDYVLQVLEESVTFLRGV